MHTKNGIWLGVQMPPRASREAGVVMMIAVIFFVAISSLVVLGLSGPAAREYRSATNAILSKQSYFLAESGVEDMYYRLKTGMPTSPEETLVLGTNSTTTTLGTAGTTTTITSVGDAGGLKRSIAFSAVNGSRRFSVVNGAETGQGGIILTDGTSHIDGSVYSNGPITGDSGTYITGSATSANSAPLSLDQSSGSGDPTTELPFGDGSLVQNIAQGFKISSQNPVHSIELSIKKTGAPADATVTIVTDAGGTPGTTVIATGVLSGSSVTGEYGWVPVTLAQYPMLSPMTQYWIVIRGGISSGNYYTLGAASTVYEGGTAMLGAGDGTWSDTVPSGLDVFFKIYTGGFTGRIQGTSGSSLSPIAVGRNGSGNAWAHTVNYTSATGTITCAEGTGNTPDCISGSDPLARSSTVQPSAITDWKADAVLGGTTVGNFTVASGGSSLGPKKIVGSVTVRSGRTLTVNGTLWITGDLSISGGSRIKLSPSYSSESGVVIVDGTININGAIANGSGSTGSNIILVSTSASSSAISATGLSGTVVLYAPYGTAGLLGTSVAKQVTAYKTSISGGSSVSYDPSLTTLTVHRGTSAPAYSVSSWKETQ